MRGTSIEFVLLIGASLFLDNVKAHLAITRMVGETNGLTGKGFGTLDGAPRDGTARDPFQLDTPVIREIDIVNGIASVCGRTLMEGKIDMKDALDKAEDGGLPDVGKGGIIKLIAHQVNADGGGPYSCAVDYTATGNNFEPIEMIMNLPGQNGRSDARAIDLPIHAKMPAGATCRGGADGQTCIVRCLNGAKAGPFGGCMAFTQKQGLFDDPAPAGSGPTPGSYVDPITENPITRFGDVFHDDNAKLEAKAAQGPVTITPIPDQVIPANEKGNGNGKGKAGAKGKAKRRDNIYESRESHRRFPARTNAERYLPYDETFLQHRTVERRQGKNPGNNKNAVGGAPASNTNLGKLDVMPPKSRIAPDSQGKQTPASTTFGTKAGKARVRRSPQTPANGRQTDFPEFPVSKVGHVDPIAPTKEGIMYEIAVNTLAQADTPRNVRKEGKGGKRLRTRQTDNVTNPKGLTKDQILQAERTEAQQDGGKGGKLAKAQGKGKAKAKLRVRAHQQQLFA